MAGKLINRFTLGLGIGYVLGARAGRERYQEIVRLWDRIVGTRTVRRTAERVELMAGEVTHRAQEIIGSKVPAAHWLTRRSNGGRSISEVMSANVETVRPTDPVTEAAAKMREQDISAVVVVDDSESVVGIVTDRDIAIRGVAEGRGPDASVADLVGGELMTVSPEDSVDRARLLMRDHSIRQLPVVVNGKAVGVVSLDDLAIERDRPSVLADLSGAPPHG